MKEKDRKELVALVDVSIIMHNIRQAREQKNYLESVLSNLRYIKSSLGADKVICVCDNGHSSYRKELYPAYKEHREKARAEYSEVDKEKLKTMRMWYDALPMFENTFLSVNVRNVEGDDLLSLLHRDLTARGYEVVSASCDKDLITAININELYDIRTSKFYSLEDKAFGLSPNKYLQWQTLMGDPQDNVPQICTKKASLILVENFSNFPAMIKFDGEVTDLKGVTPHNKRYVVAALAKLKEDNIMEQLKLNYELVKIFRDTSKLNEVQLEQYNEVLNKVLNWEATNVVSSEVEEFLWEQNSSHLIPNLEMGV